MLQMLEIDLDVFTAANPTNGGNQAYGSVRFHFFFLTGSCQNNKQLASAKLV